MKKAVLCSLTLSAALYANVFELGEIEVTALKEGVSDSNIEVIDQESIQKTETKRVPDVAKSTPGVYYQPSGGSRNETNLIVRGFKSTAVPIYMDGIPIYVPYDGNMDLGRFVTGDLSRITISKGASSVLYGPNALGGAVNLVSMKPTRELEGSVYYGFTTGKDSDTYSNLAGLRLGTKQDLFYLQLSGQLYDVEGRQASSDSKFDGKIPGTNSDDYKISLKAAFTPNETDEYAFIYSKQEGEKEARIYEGKNPSNIGADRYWKWKDWDKESYYFLSHTQFDSFYLKTKAFYDKFENTLDSYSKGYVKKGTKNEFVSIYDDYSWGLGAEAGSEIFDNDTLKFAVNYKKDVHREHNVGDPEQEMSDETVSFALENTYDFSDMTSLVVGLSYDMRDAKKAEYLDAGVLKEFPMDDNDAFNYQALLRHSFDENDELTLSFAKKTRFPTMKDRYSYRFGRYEPNPYLDEEIAYHYEIGYNRTFFDELNLGAAIFYSDVKDKIQEVYIDKWSGGKQLYQNQNVGDVDFFGVELSAVWMPTDTLELGANYTYIDADESTDKDGKKIYMTDIPEHKFYAYMDWEFVPKWNLYISQYAQSGSKSTSDGEYETSGFGATNLKVSYEPKDGLKFDIGVNNIFDKYYEFSEGYGEDGRTFFLNARYDF